MWFRPTPCRARRRPGSTPIPAASGRSGVAASPPPLLLNGCHRLNVAPNKAKRLVLRVILVLGAFARHGRGAELMSTGFSGEASATRRGADVTTFSIILALSFSHFLND